VRESKTVASSAAENGRRRRGVRNRIVAGALAVLTIVPGVALGKPAEVRAAALAGCSDAAGHVVDAVGFLPYVGGPISALADFIQGFTGDWDCGNENLLQQMIEVAREQAELVYDANTLEIFGNGVDDQIAVLGGLSYPVEPTDEDRKALVDDLDDVWRALGVIEQTGRTRSFQALPAMSTLAGVKISTLTLALQYETLRVGKWRTLNRDRVREAQESLSYLAELETKLDRHIQDRFTRGTEEISTACGSFSCTLTFRIFVLDNTTDDRIWTSKVLTLGGIAPNPAQQAAYDAAVATANSRIATAKAGVHNTYFTSDYLAIKAALQAHANEPVPTLFHTRGSVCNPDQYAILRPPSQDLAVTAVDGSVEESPLALSGTLAQAQANPSAQFQLIRYGKSFILKVRDADLTVNVWGGSAVGKQLKLYGDLAYAQTHPNSLFYAYLNWDDELILKVSDRDLTAGLAQSPQAGSLLTLNKSLTAAESDAASRFRVTCYPEARRAA
jgi:hypothetical protein